MERYSRQIILDNFGTEKQEILSGSTVGILGVGGLGCPAATYLAGAGIGKLILVDSQSPEESNLNRQILHWPEDIGRRSKSESAAWKLERFNPDINVAERTAEVDDHNIKEIFGDADVILDCTDNFSTRMILNEYCINSDTPFIHAAVESWHGQITTIIPKTTPCLKCMFPNQPPAKNIFPILGPTAGIFGSMQALEAVKVLTGIGDTLASKLLVGDTQYNQWDVIEIKKRENCPACKTA